MIWADVVVGIWLLYSAWEDYKHRLIDMGVPLAIVLTRVAVEGPFWIPKAFLGVLPIYAVMRVLEKVHILFPRKFDGPVWAEGDTYLLTAVLMYLGIGGLSAFWFWLLALLSVAVFGTLTEVVAKKKNVGEAINSPFPFAPGVLIAYGVLEVVKVLVA